MLFSASKTPRRPDAQSPSYEWRLRSLERHWVELTKLSSQSPASHSSPAMHGWPCMRHVPVQHAHATGPRQQSKKVEGRRMHLCSATAWPCPSSASLVQTRRSVQISARCERVSERASRPAPSRRRRLHRTLTHNSCVQTSLSRHTIHQSAHTLRRRPDAHCGALVSQVATACSPRQHAHCCGPGRPRASGHGHQYGECLTVEPNSERALRPPFASAPMSSSSLAGSPHSTRRVSSPPVTTTSPCTTIPLTTSVWPPPPPRPPPGSTSEGAAKRAPAGSSAVSVAQRATAPSFAPVATKS
jgi:hypothetical protein